LAVLVATVCIVANRVFQFVWGSTGFRTGMGWSTRAGNTGIGRKSGGVAMVAESKNSGLDTHTNARDLRPFPIRESPLTSSAIVPDF
jgi:hypothetical protein